ncbi:MAG: hypothetical protein IJM04_03005 [Prevotella sp.]|nr:hypothetical protein [Prevotella sp.]
MRTTFITFILLATALINTSAQDQTTAADYERQIVASYTNKDMATLDSLLKSYYNTGLYPIDVLMYNYNELQGMEDWSVIVMSSAESLIGKLILQRVLNEHRDKVLVCIETGGLDATICGKLGIAEPQTSGRPEEVFEQTIKWVAEHSERKVYFPFTDSPLFKQFPDAMKACIYNEGLTMRYSTTPYDNIAVKIRNLEERYLTDYLKLSLQPYNEKRDQRLYRRFTPGMLALNYSAIYIDMLPYYQKHRPDRVEWLQNLYGACLAHYNVLSVGSFLNNEP